MRHLPTSVSPLGVPADSAASAVDLGRRESFSWLGGTWLLAAGAVGIGLGTWPGGRAHAQAARQAAFELITPAEAKRELEARSKSAEPEAPPEVRSRGGLSAPQRPAIRLIAPTQLTVTTPLRIELAFDTLPDAKMVPSSFRVLYGALKLDLTERLRRYATVTETGVVVDRAAVPDGAHRLLMQVSDEKGNLAQLEVRLRVGVAS